MYVIVTTQLHTSAITVAHTCAYIDAPLSHPLITHMTFGDEHSNVALAGILAAWVAAISSSTQQMLVSIVL